ncbi:hypothetical protein IAR55_005039 [Kwoniella newhampshirensis]|uniref:F-box domain-containing protein n=1 Tax=Kwoniella newhampshirensis TaxID=1651941 RepID=A0AAW0YJ80_9TREE
MWQPRRSPELRGLHMDMGLRCCYKLSYNLRGERHTQCARMEEEEVVKGMLQPEHNDSPAMGDPMIPPKDGRCLLLEMPGEILSQIACCLSLETLIPFLSLHPILITLTQSHLSPLPSSIRQTLQQGPPYPQALSVLPHLNSFLPPSPSARMRLILSVLVVARARWIVERFEFGRWDEELWKEAFERRFLPSWKRLKGDDDTWRAVFLRTLGRLEHRQSGCTHEEAWTRFVTLHRNGSASINRIYSRTFDPYEIYDELKHQNNFTAHPTQVRVLLHLQDVRILAIGVLSDQPSLFVNPNAHLALHPPALRHISTATTSDGLAVGSRWYRSAVESSRQGRSSSSAAKTGAASPGANTNEAYFPLVRSMSPSTPQTTTYGLGEGSSSTQIFGPSSPSLRSTLSSFIPGRRRNPSTDSSGQQEEPGLSSSLGRLGGVLTTVSSREDEAGRRRTWSFGRTRSGSITTASAYQPGKASSLHSPINGSNTQIVSAGLSGSMPVVTEANSPPNENGIANGDDKRYATPPLPPKTRDDRPYSTLSKPQPHLAYTHYPNFTSPQFPVAIQDATVVQSQRDSMEEMELTRDTRMSYFEVEDEYEGGLWGGDVSWGSIGSDSGAGQRMAEWDEGMRKRKRWVGPMILIAQLHPSTRPTPHPPGSDPNTPLEGLNVDLGPKGMYASLGLEDLNVLIPWVELKGGGGNSGEARRSGLGF